jgi:hypothetical protein
MIQPKKILIYFLLTVALFSLLAQAGMATAASFQVAAGEEATRTLNLAVDDRVLIEFTVSGGQYGNTLHFFVTYPNGTAKDFGFVSTHSQRFVADKDGECVLHFSNEGSSDDKYVSLDYEIDHYICGMPQMLFLTIVIVIICIAAVAVFILMGKTH